MGGLFGFVEDIISGIGSILLSDREEFSFAKSSCSVVSEKSSNREGGSSTILEEKSNEEERGRARRAQKTMLPYGRRRSVDGLLDFRGDVEDERARTARGI